MRIVAVVEGYGEVQAVPELLRRMAAWLAPAIPIEIPQPWRAKRQLVFKEGELERIIETLRPRLDAESALLLLLDADDDCPANLGPAWLGDHMNRRYSETLDQVALAAVMDLSLARRADSFDKLVRDFGRLLNVPVPDRSVPIKS